MFRFPRVDDFTFSCLIVGRNRARDLHSYRSVFDCTIGHIDGLIFVVVPTVEYWPLARPSAPGIALKELGILLVLI